MLPLGVWGKLSFFRKWGQLLWKEPHIHTWGLATGRPRETIQEVARDCVELWVVSRTGVQTPGKSAGAPISFFWRKLQAPKPYAWKTLLTRVSRGVSPAIDGSQTKSLTEYALATNHGLNGTCYPYVLRDCQPGKKDLRGSGRPESGAGATALSEQGRWAVALKKPKLQREEQTASALLT